ncbi:MAG: dihydropteroate synthase [Chlorobiaceae bacterium]
MDSIPQKVIDFQINCAGQLLDLSAGPQIMGILNTTPDSFYDGGKFHGKNKSIDLDQAVDHALEMIRNGASIIDIGGESSRPGAEKISAKEEIERTLPLITLLRKKSDILISIDTYKAEVAEKALQAGVHIINDISGFTFDDALPRVCQRYQAAAILMHTPVKPEAMHWNTKAGCSEGNIISRVTAFLEHSIAIAEKNSINNIIIDPGFGFGKSVSDNFQLLGRLRLLHSLGKPILVGISRKSFLGNAITQSGSEMLPPSERLPATIAAETIALMHGASILRVHDVAAAVQSLLVFKTMQSERNKTL